MLKFIFKSPIKLELKKLKLSFCCFILFIEILLNNFDDRNKKKNMKLMIITIDLLII